MSGSFEELGAPREVPAVRTRGQGLRLGASLVVAGLVVGAIAVVGAIVIGGFAQTEAGLCRLTWAPCAELSVASVEALSGVDLPAGSVVVSGYAQETSTVLEFRAEVVLPESADVSLSGVYRALDAPAPDLVPAAKGAGLTYSTSYDSVGDGHSSVAEGTRRDGRSVLFFDTLIDPRTVG